MTESDLLAAPAAPRRRNSRRAGAFAAAGASGLVVNTVALAVLTERFHAHYLIGVLLATQCSTLWNFQLIDRLVFSTAGHSLRAGVRRYVQFAAVNNIALLLRGPMVVVMVSGLSVHYLVANVISLGLLFVARFVLADRWIWSTTPEPSMQSIGG